MPVTKFLRTGGLRPLAAAIAAAIVLTSPALSQECKTPLASLSLGVASTDSLASTASRWDPLATHLTKVLGLPTTMRYATEYAGVIEAMRVGQIQGAHMAAAQYATLLKTTGGNVEPIIKEINAYGSPGYQSIIIVPTASPVQSVQDLKGRSIAFPDPNSTSGYLVPFFELSKLGYMRDGFFSQTGFAGNHEQAILAVVNGTYDAATTFRYSEKASQPSRLVERGMIPPNSVRVIWTSNFIPDGPFVVRKDLPDCFKEKLAQAFLNLPDEITKSVGAGQWKGWERSNPETYQNIIDILAANEAARRKR